MDEKIYPDMGVAILAGGASRRFGSDKALVRLNPDGPTIIERTIATAQQLSDRIVIVGHEHYASLGLAIPIVPDDAPGRGPLAGIATALRTLQSTRVLVLACDMPCLSVPVLRWMIERASTADAVVPRTNDGRWQTMHAIYRNSALGAIDRALATGNGSVQSIFEHLTVEELSESELREIDPELNSLFSMNTLNDLDRAQRCA